MITENEKDSMDEQTRDEMLLAIINHHRHNWLNDLQLLFGYTQLKKYDRLESFIEKLKERLENERMMSRIPIPSLAIDLLYFLHQHHKFELTINMMQDHPLYSIPHYREKLRKVMLDTLYMYDRLAVMPADGHNDLSVDAQIDHAGMAFHFAYTGLYVTERVEDERQQYIDANQQRGDQVRWQQTLNRIDIELVLTRPI